MGSRTAAALGLLALVGASALREALPRDRAPATPDAGTLTLVGVGHPAVGGVVAWIGAVRVFVAADPSPSERDRDALDAAVNTTLDLDPRLAAASTLGSIALARWGRPRSAIAVLDRGLAARPDDAALHRLRGLAALAWAHDAVGAREHLSLAAALSHDAALATFARSLSPAAP